MNIITEMTDMTRSMGRLADCISTLSRATDNAITILAQGILELEDPESNHCMTIGTRNALRELAKRGESSE